MAATFKTNTENQSLNDFNKFRNEFGDGENGFASLELSNEFSRLKRIFWGSNLIILETEIKAGRFYPQFNVFD